MPATAIVIIGRNEGERLRRCLLSVAGAGRVVIYVDSNSSDGSPDLARSLGADLVDLDMSVPFSAARARNAGVERLQRNDPSAGFVQFIDGDCELAGGWLEAAEKVMREQPLTAAVCGRLRERSPEQSIYNRLADLEWDTPTGEVKSCGGIAMMRLTCFRDVGGFDPSVVAGEEPELCQRFRERGWTILRLPDEMALHDSAMLHFSQWWKRSVRSGYGAMDVATRFRRGKDGLFVKQIHNARMWGILLPVVITCLAILAAFVVGKWAALAVVIAGAALWPLQAIRLALRVRQRVSRFSDAMAYGVLMVVGKWGNLLGQVRYRRDRSLGKNLRLIEYKPSTPGLAHAASAGEQ